MKKYNIEVNKKQLEIILSALEAYTRAGTHQFDIMMEAVTKWKYNYETNKKVNRAIREIIESPLDEYESFGIHSTEIDDDYRKSYDLIQVLRYTKSWGDVEDSPEDRDKNFMKYHTRNYDTPYKTAVEDCELATCELKDE